MEESKHYHYQGDKPVGECDGRLYIRYGTDFMRMENGYGISEAILRELQEENVRYVEVGGLQAEIIDFTYHGRTKQYGDFEPQVFLEIGFWR